MADTFRALCAELVDIITAHANPDDYAVGDIAEMLARARAALAKADGPAVPDGREPASVVGEPSDEDLWNTADLVFQANSWPTDAIRYARAVLARWGNPAPQPPAEGEVAELVQHLHHAAEVDDWDGASPEWCQSMLRAADLLQRLSPPQPPVPVSERLPGPEDCDAEGRCWVWWKNGVRWVLDEWTHHELREGQLSDCVSHWLPAHALPIPHQQESING